MSRGYHDGEMQAQRRAGVRDLAERVGRIIRPTIPAAAAEFLAEQSLLIVATRRRDGVVRASALCGKPGFACAAGETSIAIRPTSGHIDTVFEDLRETGRAGILAIDFANKRRLRANGLAVVDGEAILLSTAEVYGNCPQYITQRDDKIELGFARTGSAATLNASQRRTIAAASTFFIASAHPERGADASHRGGASGFVRVDENRLSWSDYAGNNMFNTIGNLLVNPRCGLLFVDFATGATLRIEGTASVQWEPERRVEVIVDRCSETA